MPKFLIQATYTSEGAKGLLKDGASSRRAAVDQVVTGLGGEVEAMYFAFGESDTVIVVDFPDAVSMAAVSLAVKASGALQTRATPLLTLDEVDEATRREVTFRARAGSRKPRVFPVRPGPSLGDRAPG
ncbi:GYD domain-containing protein [Streptomyces sp. INA 01156]